MENHVKYMYLKGKTNNNTAERIVTIAYSLNPVTGMLITGHAVKAPGDVFNKETGRQLAYTSYLNSKQAMVISDITQNINKKYLYIMLNTCKNLDLQGKSSSNSAFAQVSDELLEQVLFNFPEMRLKILMLGESALLDLLPHSETKIESANSKSKKEQKVKSSTKKEDKTIELRLVIPDVTKLTHDDIKQYASSAKKAVKETLMSALNKL